MSEKPIVIIPNPDRSAGQTKIPSRPVKPTK